MNNTKRKEYPIPSERFLRNEDQIPSVENLLVGLEIVLTVLSIIATLLQIRILPEIFASISPLS